MLPHGVNYGEVFQENHLSRLARPDIGIIFQSYERLPAIAAYARRADELGLSGGFWIAEAYHWFRRYGFEARGAMVTLAAAAMAAKNIPLGLGTASPYLRHPTILAAEACALDELTGGRFIMGLGAGRMGTAGIETDLSRRDSAKIHREAVRIFRRTVRGEAFHYVGETFAASMPSISPERRCHRDAIPVYIGATGPRMQTLAGEIADGLLLPPLTTPAFVKFAIGNLQKGLASARRPWPNASPLGATILSSISRDGDAARAAVRPHVAAYLVNKVRGVQGNQILVSSGITDAELAPLRDRVFLGSEDLTDLITAPLLRRFNIAAGTPDEVAEALQKLIDAGVNLPLMAMAGADEDAVLDGITLLAEEVVPRLMGAPDANNGGRGRKVGGKA
jgi:5,10-methylenetetrahydromethanopterin reductase